MNPLADAALRASVVLLIGLALRAVLRRRSPALRHIVLAAVILAAPVVALVGAFAPGVALPARLVDAPSRAIVAAESAGTGTRTAVATTATVDADAPRPAGGSRAAALIVIWIAGAALSLGWLLAAAIRLRRVVASASPVEDARWRLTLAAVCDDAGLRRPVRLLVSPDAMLLATWGWRRPRVVIPACALGWSDERARSVLAHEVAHVARHDWLLQSIAETLRALLWWNPLAWLACRALRDDSELACDDAVLHAGVGATAYADHLLQIARLVAPGPVPAAAVMRMARVSTLERRIVAMLNPRLDRRLPSRAALLGGAAALALLVLPVAILRAAQPAARQLLEGTVYDTTGAVLPGVAVTLDADAAKVQTTTDRSGRFRFDGVEPGSHVIQVESPGFRALRQSIQLKNDADWNRVVMLQVGELRETIAVSRRRPASITPLTDGSGPTPVRVGGNIRAPRKVENVNPDYPQRLLEAGLQGKVVVEAVVGVDGRVVRTRALTMEAHPDFAKAAVEAVRQWRYEPTLLNGSPIEVVMTVTVDFSLE